jgi:hypothetical protein
MDGTQYASTLEVCTMAATRSFLDNLANLRLVLSVALEHIQANRDHFLKAGTTEQVRQAQRLISKIETLIEELEKEFTTLENLVAQQRRLM